MRAEIRVSANEVNNRHRHFTSYDRANGHQDKGTMKLIMLFSLRSVHPPMQYKQILRCIYSSGDSLYYYCKCAFTSILRALISTTNGLLGKDEYSVRKIRIPDQRIATCVLSVWRIVSTVFDVKFLQRFKERTICWFQFKN